MGAPVFVSYARRTSASAAGALRDALGADLCFLDTQDLDAGDEFPRALTDALLAARVFVGFADEAFFQRWYCLREWLLARAPLDEVLRRGGTRDAIAASVDHIVLALGAGADDRVVEHLPPVLRGVNWPAATATGALAALVRAKLDAPGPTLHERCEVVGVAAERRSALVDEAAMPAPQNLAGVPLYPRVLPQSLGPRFVGRVDDIWRVHAALSETRLDNPQFAALTGALQGGGGFGKTQLAREYLHRFGRSHYPGGCFWIDAAEAEPIERQFHGVLSGLRSGIPAIEDMRAVGRDVRTELADVLDVEAVAKSMLFVVDNVPEPAPDAAPQPLDAWCPALGKVTCLATSRKRLDAAGAASSIDVDVVDRDAAIALLSSSVPGRSRLNAADWGAIAEWVGRLPLALTLLHAALRMGATSPSTLLAASRNQSTTAMLDTQMQALRTVVPKGALRGITDAFELSYGLLSDDAKRLARVLAWFAPAPIPFELLAQLPPNPTGVPARVALIDRGFLLEVRAVGSGGVSGWQMHRTLADFLRTQSQEPRAELSVALSSVGNLLASLNLNLPDARALGLAVVQHAVAATQWLATRVPDFDRSAPESIARSLYFVANVISQLGAQSGEPTSLEAAVQSYEVAATYAPRAAVPALWARIQNDRGIALHNLGEGAQESARIEQAVAAYRSTLEVWTFTNSPTEWAMVQNNLANALVTLGERDKGGGTDRLMEAVGAYRAALEVLTRDRNPRAWAQTQHNLAQTALIIGTNERAPTHVREAVAAFRSSLEVITRHGDPMRWAMVQNNLGHALQVLANFEDREDLLWEALAAHRDALEVSTRDRAPLQWAMTQNNVAMALAALGTLRSDTNLWTEARDGYVAAIEVLSECRAPYWLRKATRNLAIVEDLLANERTSPRLQD